MKLDLDPERLRNIMQVWRDLLDMKIDMSPGVRSHLFAQRSKHLHSIAETAANWLTVLRSCTVEADAKEEYELIVRDIEKIRTWAMGALVELKVLEIEEKGAGL